MTVPPGVTVVIPSYNHARYIAQAIASVCDQTYPNLELIIIDDGSQDDSVAVIASVLDARGDGRARFIVQGNAGAAATLNRAIMLGTMPYVAILNSDDYYAPTRLAEMLALAPPDGAFLAFSGVTLCGARENAEAVTEGSARYANWLDTVSAFPTAGFGLLLVNFAMSSSNFVFSRALFDQIGGFDPALRVCHDWGFLIDAVAFTEPVFVPELLLSYRLHGSNTIRALAHLGEPERAQVMARYAAWAGAETQNHRAPSSANWPRYAPMFIGVIDSLFPAHRLKPAVAAEPAAGFGRSRPAPEESRAIRALFAKFRAETDPPIPVAQAMAQCAAAWARG